MAIAILQGPRAHTGITQAIYAPPGRPGLGQDPQVGDLRWWFNPAGDVHVYGAVQFT
jgi:hypothetical protein